MSRDGITGERIEHEDVKLTGSALGKFAFHHQPCIAKRDLNASMGILNERKVPVREIHHLRVDFVEPDGVAMLGDSGQRAGAQPDDPDASVINARKLLNDQADAAARSVVERWPAAVAVIDDLRAVVDLPMRQRDVRLGPVRMNHTNKECAVEIPGPVDHAMVGIVDDVHLDGETVEM